MEATMENVILKELREFRTELNEFREESNQKWEENNRKWEQNEKRWEENTKQWEQNEKRWEENERRWQQNEKRWEENEKRWQQNEKRWEENDKKLEKINERIDSTNQRLDGTNERVTALEEGRKKDRRDILVVLDTMEKSISNQFAEMREYFDAKFDKVFSAQRLNDIENEQFKKIFCAHEKRLNFYNARLNYLEEWKQQFDMGEYTAV